jgi:hypothetical protein
MTEHDLSTLVRDHVSSDEPPFAGLDGVIAGGRRTVRRRRLASGVGVAAVLAVAGALVVPQLGDDSGTGPRGIDVAIQRALDRYDADAMPEMLEATARSVLSRSVADLGPGRFTAYSSDGVPLEPGDYGQAGGMTVTFGPREHQWSVSVFHTGENDATDHQATCDQDFREGSYLECEVEVLADGVVVIHRTSALQKAGPEWGWGTVTPDQLDRVPSDILWFEHETQVLKGETFVTDVVERVKAPSLAAAEEEFVVPAGDRAELGSYPELVIPVPDDFGDNTAPALPAKEPSPIP